MSAGLVVALLGLIVYLPDRVQYVETVHIDAPLSTVYDAIRYQEQLMSWSPWPVETNSQCFVQQTDGQVGARTVYAKNGREFGYQEVTELVPQQKVSFFLKSYVAPFEEDVRMSFYLRATAQEQTEVHLFFNEKLKKPHFLIAYFGGILRWVRNMHRKDLQALKTYAESQ